MSRIQVIEELCMAEGYRQFPYHDSVGALTVGYGRNLRDRGIEEEEARYLLERDVESAEADCRTAFPWWFLLAPDAQDVCICLVFNLGVSGVQGFHEMLAALERRDYRRAADELLDSLWARQVGPGRAYRMADKLRNAL